MTVSSKLVEFVDWMNNGTEDISNASYHQIEYGTELGCSFVRQYTQRAEESDNPLRMSSLGKPAVLQAMKVLGHKEVTKATHRLRHIFHVGDFTETYILTMAKLFGFSVTHDQHAVHHLNVTGHLDAVFDDSYVIEVKSMSANYFQQFMKRPNDDRGYVTQAALYGYCMRLPIYWLCLNKGTHEVALVEPDQYILDGALVRVNNIVPKLKSIQKFEDIFENFKAPPATPEIYKRKETGRYLIPESMKYSEFAPVFYDLALGLNGYNKETLYVVDYRGAEDAEAVLDEILEPVRKTQLV